QTISKLTANLGPGSSVNVAMLKTRWANLFAEKHNPSEALALYKEALEINPKLPEALMGMAQLASEDWNDKAAKLVQQALDVNPHLVSAHLLSAQVNLEQEQFADAEKELAAVDAINARALEAWSVRAVSAYLQSDSGAQSTWLARIEKENPSYGRVY